MSEKAPESLVGRLAVLRSDDQLMTIIGDHPPGSVTEGLRLLTCVYKLPSGTICTQQFPAAALFLITTEAIE